MAIRVRRRKRSDAYGPEDEDTKVQQWRATRAEIERMKLEKLRGELMDRQQAVTMFAGWVRTFARGVLAVEGRMANTLDDAQRELLRTELRALLDALSRAGQTIKREGDGPAPSV